MRKITEGQRMFYSVMGIFAAYALVFLVFEDYDRNSFSPFVEESDWRLLYFSLVVLAGLGVLLYRYARRMDKRIEGERQQQQTVLRRELTQNIAHELKTPVASIMGFSETILDNPDLPPDMLRDFIQRTHDQAVRLSELLQNISALNKMEYAPTQFEMARVNVSRLVAEVALERRYAIEKQGMTLRNCLPENVVALGNRALLYSVLRNLIDNAIKYAGTGTTVEVSAERDDNMWRVTVSDNGKGVPQHNLPRLFERFYTVDKGRSRSLGGSGLGLSIVKNAVLLHGGEVTAGNSPEGGLAVTFTLRRYK